MKRVHLISQPRNLSTAFMYSWAQRKDTKVFDEPFYAYYLVKTGLDHPGREAVLDALPQKVDEVLEKIVFQEGEQDVLFLKNMAQHLIDMDLSFTKDLINILYIRNPKQVLASFAQVIPNPSIQDIGIKNMYEIYQSLDQGRTIVLDSAELLKDPENIWKQLCDKIGLEYDNSVLSWEAGPRKEDGVWAKYWYKNVHNSTGFSKQKTSERDLPEHLEDVYQEAKKYYDLLAQKSLKA